MRTLNKARKENFTQKIAVHTMTKKACKQNSKFVKDSGSKNPGKIFIPVLRASSTNKAFARCSKTYVATDRMIKPIIMKKSSEYNRRRVDSRVMIRAVKVKQDMLNIMMIAFYREKSNFPLTFPPQRKREKGKKQILAKAKPDKWEGDGEDGGRVNHGP